MSVLPLRRFGISGLIYGLVALGVSTYISSFRFSRFDG